MHKDRNKYISISKHVHMLKERKRDDLRIFNTEKKDKTKFDTKVFSDLFVGTIKYLPFNILIDLS